MNPTSRRDQAREQTLADIKAAARQLLREHGPTGVQLRPVAREVGMTAPALYRYVDSLDALVELMCVDAFDELCTAMEVARDAQPGAAVMDRLAAASRAFRTWAIANPAEFGLVFSTPLRAPHDPTNPTPAQQGSQRFGGIFSALFLELWMSAPFDVPAPDELAPGLVEGLFQLGQWLTEVAEADFPPGALVAFIDAWTRLHGAVALETFHHLEWAMPDCSPLFEQTLNEITKAWTTPPR
ncbi:MAG: TetR/AcrR family transcriptional regulator [Actinomycetes bacterium]